MKLTVVKSTLDGIRSLRDLFLQENNIQFIHNKCHEYGWADVYQIFADQQCIGYGSVWGLNKREDRDTIFEFYVLPGFRKISIDAFSSLASICGASHMETQTNDVLTSPLFFGFARNIQVQSILFDDHNTTSMLLPGSRLINKTDPDLSYRELKYALLLNDKEVATGGMLLNYNWPYADIYMDVAENLRGKGLGAIMVQELKRECYNARRIPAARCNVKNLASRATLLKSGFGICGYLLVGEIN
ncbi:MAG TPA: GNAT family N-acetyltransferase [Chryseolinea sp.]|nr:GNAT family N-acetyltransferase [Chryseolinea sp.]